MKTFFKILFAPLLGLLNSCSQLGDPVDPTKSDNHYFDTTKSDIRYSPMGNWFELGNSPMNADVQSFEVLSRFLSRDKNQIYFESYPIENQEIDLGTFHVKNDEFMATTGFDKDYVYVFDKVFETNTYKGQATIIENADPIKYKRIDWDWAKDGRHHFYRNSSIAADYNSFKTINDNFAKDSSQTFVKTDSKFKTFEADIETFRSLGESQNAMDKKHVYWMSFVQDGESELTVIPFADVDQVTYLNTFFLKVEGIVYFNGKAIPDADAQTFKVVSYRYGKDSKHAYYGNMIIADADLETFKVSEKYGVTDKNGSYREGKLVDQ